MQLCEFLCVLLLQEFFHYTVGAILVFIASIVAAAKSGDVSALVTASVCETFHSFNTFSLHKLTSRTITVKFQLWFPVLCSQAFGFIATFLMAVSLWTSYSVACGSPHAGITLLPLLLLMTIMMIGADI